MILTLSHSTDWFLPLPLFIIQHMDESNYSCGSFEIIVYWKVVGKVQYRKNLQVLYDLDRLESSSSSIESNCYAIEVNRGEKRSNKQW